MSEEIVPSNTGKTKTIHVLPTISLDSTDMPEVKGYDVGETYDAIVHCEMVSKHQGVDSYLGGEGDPSVIRGRFKIISIKPVDRPSNSNKPDVLKKKAASYGAN